MRERVARGLRPPNEGGRKVTEAEIVKQLGPLAALAGVWEGDKGLDQSPDPARQLMETPYRERMVFEPMGPVDNHEQQLFALRYATTAFRIGEEEGFHEELGYWLWDGQDRQVMRCFLVPRGVTILAGGDAEPDARRFQIAAEVGSETYGICSNRFLDREFKTVRYELEVTVQDDGSLHYAEDTQLQIKGQGEIFHHRDENTLKRVG
ncbi:MAG: FABP family protein [Deltaproteobacteria bacterium]|jgi:hypothetical protein|nr:FABP family protein [Deltaproteobacteria bacterium]MBW2497131.1 FABP family protein [Deltaproteobacteria bacterium]